MGILLDPLLRPITVQLTLVLLIFGWWQSRPFGPILPRLYRSRHNIVDHTDTVGTLYWKTGDGRGALRLYLKQLVTELKLRSFRGQEERILEPIARRLRKDDASSVQKLLRKAHQAARSPQVDRQTAAELIRRLSRIRQAASPLQKVD